MGYKFSTFCGSSYGVGDGYGKFGVIPRTIHIYYQKFYSCIDGGDFVSYQSRYYPSIFHSKKYRYFIDHIGGWRINSVLLAMKEVGLVIGPTIFLPRSIISVQIDMMGIFGHLIVIAYNPSWRHQLLGVIQIILQVIIRLMFQLVIVKVAWVLLSPTLPPIKTIVGLIVVIFVSSKSRDYLAMFHPKNTSNIIHYLWDDMINVVLLVMIEVVLVLVLYIYPPRKLILTHTGIMGGFIHNSVIVHHHQWCHNSVCIIQLVLMVVLNLVFQIVMVKVVWVLGTPKFSPKNMIVGLMVVVLCHIWVGIIQPWSITTRTGPILYYIIKGRINLALMVMVEVGLIKGQHASTPLRVNLVRDRNGCFFWSPKSHHN